jgi:3,4-dihydroxy 2-butanone 4-phosphate synthase/GTP cyclohydrolase II
MGRLTTERYVVRPLHLPSIIDSMFSPLPDILDDLRRGQMVILTDDENRENEGDLILPAQFVTPEAITFMLSVARGYLCLSLTEADCDRLNLQPQAPVNTTVRGTAFTVSIDGHPRHGFTTGVSAKERAKCIKMAIEPSSKPEDFVRPGHINPLRSRDGGTLVRTGQTEGSLDLCRLAGLYPAAAIIEIMRDDGEMARLPDLERLCVKHNLKLGSVAQIIEHRLARESLIRRLPPTSGTLIRTVQGKFNLIAYDSIVDPLPHIALTMGGIGNLGEGGRAIDYPEPTLVRVHRQNLLGDIFGDIASSPGGQTGDTLRASMAAVAKEGKGVVVYLRPESAPGFTDIEQRLRTIRRPAAERDTPDLPAVSNHIPERDLGIGSQILRDLGLHKLRLLTDSNYTLPGLDAFGLQIVERVPVLKLGS